MSSMRMSDHGLVNEYSIYSTERLEHRRCVFCAPSRPRTALSLSMKPAAEHRTGSAIAAGALAVLLAACASGGRVSSSQRTACGLASQDSVFLAGGMVYHDCAVDRRARLLTTDIHPDYRPTPGRATCYSVDLEFVVSPSGLPETRTARVVRTNDQGWAESVMSTLSSWKYEPAIRESVPVRQIVTEHKAMQVMVAVVRAGSPPPSVRPSQVAPSC